jgi:hypothetical protein
MASLVTVRTVANGISWKASQEPQWSGNEVVSDRLKREAYRARCDFAREEASHFKGSVARLCHFLMVARQLEDKTAQNSMTKALAMQLFIRILLSDLGVPLLSLSGLR